MGKGILFLIFLLVMQQRAFSQEDNTKECPFQSNSPTVNQSLQVNEDLLIFISFNMPKTSLIQWSVQAKKAGGVLVLKGFKNNSLKETLAKARALFGEHDFQNIVIDPIAYEDFQIKNVPAVVITEKPLKTCSQEKCNTRHFDVVYGDSGLEYALKKIADSGDLSQIAQHYLIKLNT